MKTLHALLILTLCNCTTDGSTEDDRGGPDALSGISWHTKLQQNGIDFDFSFVFNDTTLAAANKCSAGGEALTASVSTPVKYRYTANVPRAGHGGDSACYVDVAAGMFAFEIAGNKLIVQDHGQTVEFTQSGTRSGLYGDWTAMGNGFEITWSMKNGKIHATAACPGGGSASTSVDADFKNFVDILEAKETTVGDDSFNCSVGIAKAMSEYYFEGSDLVMVMDGKSITFRR